jgi:hypothetical protein
MPMILTLTILALWAVLALRAEAPQRYRQHELRQRLRRLR